jgi:DNA-binding transcriptional LysR family regulator
MEHNTQLGTIALFCKAAELGGFTAAANSLGITPAAVSRGIGRIEDRLGVKLFQRTTRNVQLTDDGRIYFEQCRAALTQIDDAERFISGNQKQPRGKLKISMPTTYAHYRVMPRLPEFIKRYPSIDLEINVSNRNVDFVEENYDATIRLGMPPDSRLIGRKLEDAPLGVYAHPKYLAEKGEPKRIKDLELKKIITLPFIRPSTGRPMAWLFNEHNQPIDWQPTSRIHVSSDPLSCVALACAGMGIAQTFSWVAQAHEHSLVEILKPHSGRSRPFYLLYPQSRHLSASLRAFIAFLNPTGLNMTVEKID